MTCALAPAVALAAVLAGPMCPRADRPVDAAALLAVALTGSEGTVAAPLRDPQFEAQIRAIHATSPNHHRRPARRRRTR